MRQEDDLRRKMSRITRVPFSEELQRQILHKARTMGQDANQNLSSNVIPHRTHRRLRWQSWLVAGVGSVAAMAMVFSAWQFGQRGTTDILGLPTAAETAAQPLAGTYGLQAADISVGYIGVEKQAGTQQGHLVQAMLTNMGTTPLRPRDLFGVLAFSPGGNAQGVSEDPLTTADWAAFVEPPDQVILPGQSVSWSFLPIGAPENASGHLDEQPSLVFYRTGLVPPPQADQVWTRPQVKISNVAAQVLSRWSTGQSLRVDAHVTNVSAIQLPLRKTWALVWFAPTSLGNTGNPSLGLDWTGPQVVRFLSTVQPTDGPSTLAPGQSAEVSFQLVAGAKTSFQQLNSYVTLIWQPGGGASGKSN
ncbi:hypothetical protein D2Q93_01975 [Alicyclobacillaceae bacterium I2511]|nr:hypothetical protein D2Q93_01975 [Alicyclobacillaceae bacterium I2511]